MLREDALQLIQRTAVKAAEADILKIPGDDRRAFIVQNGERQEIKLSPANRDHKLDDVDELCRFIADRATFGDSPKNTIVFHGETAVVALLDDADRRDRVTLDLLFTSPWRWVVAAAKSPPKLTAKEFLTLLKTTLDECVDEGDLHDWQVALRNVRLSTKVATEQTTDRGLEKLGREIENQCAGAEAVPEVLTVSAPVYRNCGEVDVVADVAFDVSIDFEAGRFVLTPIGDRIANAVDACQHGIGEYIRARTGLKSVFHGTP